MSEESSWQNLLHMLACIYNDDWEKGYEMAYVSKETKKELAPAIKKVLAEYGVKGTIKVNNYSTLVVTLRKIPAGLFTPKEIANNDVNVYHIDTFFDGTAKKFLNKLLDAMKGPKYFNNDDAMTDSNANQ